MPSKDSLRQIQDRLAPERNQWRKRNAYYYQSLANFFQRQIPRGSRVLEVGCSTGELLAATQPGRGVGIDLSRAVVEIAQHKFPHLEFHQGDIEDFTFNETFDYIILSDVVGELTDVQTAFDRLSSACHSDTRLIISYYNYLWEPALRAATALGLRMPVPLQNWLPLTDLANLLYLTGYDTIRSGNFLIFPAAIPFIAPFINRYISPLPIVNKLGLVEYIVARRTPAPQPPDSLSCTVVIPCRNEQGTIEEAVQRLPVLGQNTEIIFIEGHSHDNTWTECLRVQKAYPDKNIVVIQQTQKGKGNAVREAFARATGDVLIILDADLTVPPEDLPKFFNALAAGKGEFINGSRLVYPMEKQAMRFLNLLGNKFFGSLFSYLLDQPLRDTLCGTKALQKRHYEFIAAHRDYFGDFDPFGDFDLLLGAARLNLKIVEVPVRYRERVYGETNISRFSHGWLLLRMALVAMQKLKFVD